MGDKSIVFGSDMMPRAVTRQGSGLQSSKSSKHRGTPFLLVLILSMVGCSGSDSKGEPRSTSYYNHVYGLHTVDHDGHTFVLWNGSSKGGILHHPDCKCGRVQVLYSRPKE